MRRYNLVLKARDEGNLADIMEATDCSVVQAIRVALHLAAKIARKEARIFSTDGEREVWILDLE